MPGIGATLPYEKATLENWKAVIDTNLECHLWCACCRADHLKQGFGHIVNTSSIAGVTPPPFQALYCLTKYGVTGLTESLRYEYAEKGLNFSTICPANIATPIFQRGVTARSTIKCQSPMMHILLTKQHPTSLTGLQNVKGLSSCLKSRLPICGGDTSSETSKLKPRCYRWHMTAGYHLKRKVRITDESLTEGKRVLALVRSSSKSSTSKQAG